MRNYKWVKVKNTLPNLNVLHVNTVEVGFIYKPMDDKYSKNAWRVHIGIGDKTKFMGHKDSIKDAKNELEAIVMVK